MARKYIHTDASRHKGKTYIGIYSEYFNLKKTITIDKYLDINDAETLGVKLAYELVGSIPDVHIFTDSLVSYDRLKDKYPVHWLPRQYNKQADKLAKPITEAKITDMANHIIKNYSVKQRIKLCYKILGIVPMTKSPIRQLYKHGEVSKRLLKSILVNELTPQQRRNLHTIKTLKRTEWETHLKRIKEK